MPVLLLHPLGGIPDVLRQGVNLCAKAPATRAQTSASRGQPGTWKRIPLLKKEDVLAKKEKACCRPRSRSSEQIKPFDAVRERGGFDHKPLATVPRTKCVPRAGLPWIHTARSECIQTCCILW